MRVIAWDKKSKKFRDVGSIVFWSQIDIEKQDGSLKLVNMVGKDCINNKKILITREAKDVDLIQIEPLSNSGICNKLYEEAYEQGRLDGLKEVKQIISQLNKLINN